MSHYIGNVNIIKFKDVVYHFFLAVLNYALFLTDVNHHTDFLFCDGFLISVGVKTEHTDYKVTLRNYCTRCGKFFPVSFIEDAAGVGDGVPRCDECGGIVKPDVVLYEEGLDEQTMENAVNAIRKADTLIVGGTSLAVYPAAGLLRYFRGDNLVVINKQPTSADAMANLLIHEPIGRTLDPNDNVEA